MPTNFFDKIEVVRMITKTLSCWVGVLLRNIISHLSLLSVSSPDPNGASGGVDHGFTEVWVGLWWGCVGNHGDNHHGCSHLFLSWLHTWGSRAWHSAYPCHHSWSSTRVAIRPLGFFALTVAGHRDGAHVPKVTFGRAPASVGDSSHRAQLHGHSWGRSCLSTISRVSPGGHPNVWGGPISLLQLAVLHMRPSLVATFVVSRCLVGIPILSVRPLYLEGEELEGADTPSRDFHRTEGRVAKDRC